MQPLSVFGQAILGLGWHHRIDRPLDQAVTLQSAEDLDENLFGDVGNLPLQFVETSDPSRQAIKDDRRPLVADQIEKTTRGKPRVESFSGLMPTDRHSLRCRSGV